MESLDQDRVHSNNAYDSSELPSETIGVVSSAPSFLLALGLYGGILFETGYFLLHPSEDSST